MHLLRLHRGTVRALTRRRAIWRGAADPPETSFSIDGVRLVFPRPVSVGEGDLVTAVGWPRGREGLRVEALRNDSTDVSYEAATWVRLGAAVALVSLAFLPIGWAKVAAVSMGAWASWRAARGHLANTVLKATPSRHRRSGPLTDAASVW
jgi:hypothetical protein